MDSKKYIEDTEKVLLHTYNRAPVVLKEGKGVYLTDTEGKKYLDFGAGIAVASLGYGNKELEEALCNQVQKLLHTSNLFYNEYSDPAAEAIIEVSGMDKVFFTNSGTEAIEGALKAARKYARENNTGKYEFIAMNKAFHGRTMGALSVTGTAVYRTPFEPLVPGVSFADFNNIEDLKEKITDKTCAVILEPVQGEGGVHCADEAYLKAVRKLCDEQDILLIFDEIQCGMGRTGEYFAWQKYQVKPDILVMAKAIGNGMPVGAFAMTDKVAVKSLKPGDHGTTYGGNPMALCAVATTIKLFKENEILADVKETGAYLRESLLKLKDEKSVIRDVRGTGLIQGIELTTPVSEVIKGALEKGLILIAAGSNVIRFVPPLVIKKEEIDKMIDILKEIL